MRVNEAKKNEEIIRRIEKDLKAWSKTCKVKCYGRKKNLWRRSKRRVTTFDWKTSITSYL